MVAGDGRRYLEAHSSTAVEGNTLVLGEVEALLEQGRALGARALKDCMEVLACGEAARWIYGQALDPGKWTTGDLISLTEVRAVCQELMAKVWEVAAHPMRQRRSHPEASTATTFAHLAG